MPLKLTAADKTDVGKQREQNEDTPYKRIETSSEGDRGLFIVADGMGGYQAGEVASRLAVETISKVIDSAHFFKPIQDQPTINLNVMSISAQDPDATVKMDTSKIHGALEAQKGQGPQEAQNPNLQQTIKLPETHVAKNIELQFTRAIQEAHAAILKYGESKTSARGLGCTVTSVLIQNDEAYIANVGDSRTYLLRKGKLKALTKDHSLVARLVEAKQIEPEDVYSHPQRNLIYRSLGAGHKTVEVDVSHLALQPDDILLLCSDGLWEMVRNEDLRKELSEKTSPQNVCNTLIDMANEHGGEDNITAIVVHVSAM
jgi:protein phosphatase